MPVLHGTAMPASDTGPRLAVADDSLRLPSPPDDQELYWYFGPQRRWVLLCATLSYTGATVTLGLFALEAGRCSGPSWC